MTDAEKVTKLATAISRADRELDLILDPMDHHTAEWSLTICRRVRNILRRALAKVQDKEASDARN